MEVFEKWGFGMSRPKMSTRAKRIQAVYRLLGLLDVARVDEGGVHDLEAISEVKGLFNRVARQDQWDWFTVSSQLGYPSARLAQNLAGTLADLRSALRDGVHSKAEAAHERLRALPLRRCLGVFLGHLHIRDELGAGWVYILSTRDHPDLLKVGMTTRTVEQRVAEINRSTGVAIPFGVRRCWRVNEPAQAERVAHASLAEFRLRTDREFFRVDFFEASKRVQLAISGGDLELRTLERLSVLLE